MPTDINGERLRMARIIRGLSSPKLASLLGVTKQAIWQYENTPVNPLPEIMFKISDTLHFPNQFFYEGYDDTYYIGKSYCRTTTSTAKTAKDAQQYYNVLRSYLYDFFQHYIAFPSMPFPSFQLSECDDMDSYTIKVRKYYGLGEEPISNMANFLENAGIILSTYHHEKDKFDGLSQAPILNGKKFRITVYNLENTTFARLQFTLGHELGHWLLGHIDSDEDTLSNEEHKENENEANLFASSLLLPKNAFSYDLRYPDRLDSYVQLKRKWKVSVATMIMRAKQLELISYSQYQNLYRQLSKRGWRTSEPYDELMVVPQPTLLPEAVELLDSNNIIKKTNLVKEFTLNCFTATQDMYESLLSLSPHTLDSLIGSQPKLKLIIAN